MSYVPEGLSPEKAKNIPGGQANMWNHIARTDSAIDSQIFPRLIALSEVLWSDAKTKTFNDFYHRLSHHYSLLDKLGVSYGWFRPIRKIDHYQSKAETLEEGFGANVNPK